LIVALESAASPQFNFEVSRYFKGMTVRPTSRLMQISATGALLRLE